MLMMGHWVLAEVEPNIRTCTRACHFLDCHPRFADADDCHARQARPTAFLEVGMNGNVAA